MKKEQEVKERYEIRKVEKIPKKMRRKEEEKQEKINPNNIIITSI